jgi:glycosyltransferase involved in cell wall biosynthesis
VKLLAVSFPCSEPIRQELYARLQAQTGWDVSIILPEHWRSEHGNRKPTRWPMFEGELIPLPVLLNGNVPLHLYRARLGRVLARARPDVIFVHHEAYGVATFQAYLANHQSVGAPIGFYSAQNRLKRYPLPFAAAESYVYRHSAFALPITPAAESVLRVKGYKGPAEVLPLPVDTGLFRPNRHTADSERRQGSDLVVGYMGRLVAEKGVDTLLAALARPETAAVRAVIGGDGPEAASLQAQADALGLNGRVRWKGYVPHQEAPDFYRSIDVLVVPTRNNSSVREQFGRVVTEALACGVPVVTSTSGELPHLVSRTGAGWVFPDGDAGALTAILGGLRGRRAELRILGGRGRLEVERQFSLDHVARRFAAVVESARRMAHAA